MRRRPPLSTFSRALFDAFFADECMTRAAALSYYATLSFGPVLLISLWVATLLGVDAQQAMAEEFRQLLGPPAGDAVEEILSSAESEESSGALAASFSGAMLLFTATGAFAQLQDTLNIIWRVDDSSPDASVVSWLRSRLLSLGMLLVLVVLALISTIASLLIAATLDEQALAASLLNNTVSAGVLTVAFAALYRLVPDQDIPWRDALSGAVLTAVLFTVGKWGIGVYLGSTTTTSAYGAAGSLLALMLWVFYSALTLLLGAEITFIWSRMRQRAADSTDRSRTSRRSSR